MTQAPAFPEENEEALEKIVLDQDLEPDDITPEDRRRQYDEQEGREIDEIPRPSADGDDSDDEDDREP
jgi:hypothetical protein